MWYDLERSFKIVIRKLLVTDVKSKWDPHAMKIIKGQVGKLHHNDYHLYFSATLILRLEDDNC